jgi:membrane-anchored mycosin MYCP
MRLAVVAGLAAVLTGVAAGPAQAAPAQAAPAGNAYWYTVTASYQGAPENLWEVAARFLGDENRAGEILRLNAGRVQPDGDRLAGPSSLKAGWQLVLPWDATGPDLHYGPVPATGKASAACAPVGTDAAAAWGQTLLAPGPAWTTADGSGVAVAVISSGVDGSAPALSGRVTAGTDVAGGAGRGDTGCDAVGTALAGIVAGAAKNFGVAPGARIIPVKAGPNPLPANLAATAIHVAGTSGARVVLVGSGVNGADPQVRAAISDVIARDVVVVLPATDNADPADGQLRVGSIGPDRKPGAGGDLSAPGENVASIVGSVSGPEYAAAFVAGTAALVRSAHPELHAADVTRQVKATAVGGIVRPVAAVSTALPAGVGVNAVPVTSSSGLGTLSRVLLWAAVALAVLMLLPYALRAPVRAVRAALARRRANRRAALVRARMAADEDDDFWDPPATVRTGSGSGSGTASG